MVVPANPLDRLRVQQAHRLRTFTILHAAGAIVAVGVVGWSASAFQVPSFVWSFAVLAVVMPVGVVLVWWLNRSNFRRTLSAFGVLESRVRDATFSLGVGYLLVLDNGLVLSTDQRYSVVRFSASFSAAGAFVPTDLAQAERQAWRVRGVQSGGGISDKKGPPDARAELDRLRNAFGAKWYVLLLRDVRADRLAAGEPPRHLVLAFFIPRWWTRTASMAQELDGLRTFLEEAPARYFRQGGVPS